jgi:DNA-binding transcriptional LysR family regulator
MAADSRLLGGLDLLAAVVQTGSFVHAGERVGLSQSGVSRAIARLEARVGVRLFDRNARAVTLTDDGRRFHARVMPLLEALGAAVDGAGSARKQVRGRLRINVDAFFASYVLAPRLPEFLENHPELEVEIDVRDDARDLVAEGFDAAVRFGEPTATGLVARRLLQTRIVTCASPAYVERHGRPRDPEELAKGHECIQFRDPSTGRPFEWEFRQGAERVKPVKVHGRLLVNDVATAVRTCVAGHGVAQFMELGTRELVQSGALIELFPDWREELFPLYVVHPSRSLPSAKVRAFLEFVTRSTLVRRKETTP